MSIKRNVIANYLGQAWQALMSLAFVPIYIKYLGIESYGLIGIFALLQAWLVLLDMGMKPALSREMARFTGGAHSAQSIRDLLRSIEVITIAIALGIALGVWGAANWLATFWLTAKRLPPEVVSHAVVAMGVVTALRFVESLYSSSLAGLQQQVQQNLVTIASATARGLGAAALLAWFSPTIEAFFLWQGLISSLNVALFATIVYRTLPPAPQQPRVSLSALIDIRQFATGMIIISFLALLLTQVDKLILARLLPLDSFGYYAFASAIANSLYMLTGPLTTALSPRFVELSTNASSAAMIEAYHLGAQLVSVLMGSVAVLLMAFGDRAILLWTGNQALTERSAPILVILVLGTMLNCLMWIPYQLQLAYGWTSLTIRVNIAAVTLLIPAISAIVPVYGVIGAAWVWVALNTGYVAFTVPLMHRRLLCTEQTKWYLQDVAAPLGASAATAFVLRALLPHNSEHVIEFTFLIIAFSGIFFSATLAAPALRRELICRLPGSLKLHRTKLV